MNFLDTRLIGNTVQDYLVSLSLFAIAIILSVVARHILKRSIYSIADRTETELDDLIVQRVLPPLTWAILLLGLDLAKGYLDFPDPVLFWLDRVLLVLWLSVSFLILMRLVQVLIEFTGNRVTRGLREKSPEDLENRLQDINRIKKQAREISNLVICVLAVLAILSSLGVNLKAVWASLGIGGIALALAVQEPLRNLVGRIYIFSTGIFDEGHFIVFNEWAGTVKHISAFRTYMELFSDMTTVSIPNADFVKGAVKSYHGRTTFIYKWDLDVPYDVTPDKIQEVIVSLRNLILGKPEVNQDMCWIYMDRLDQHAKVVRVWFQVRLPGWAESLFYGNQILHDIQLVFESTGIPFAYPTQTIHLENTNPP